LAEQGDIKPDVVAQAIKKYDINVEAINPVKA
jgi:pyruvate dehydrogenase complex dehydrogenase (E1) component